MRGEPPSTAILSARSRSMPARWGGPDISYAGEEVHPDLVFQRIPDSLRECDRVSRMEMDREKIKQAPSIASLAKMWGKLIMRSASQ